MKENTTFRIFPKRYGFFPYIFLFYLLMPTLYVSNEAGLKRIIGFVLLLLFLVTYRQLYFAIGKTKEFTLWLILQVGIILILSIFFNINNIFLGFFSSNFIGYYEDKKLFKRALILFGLTIISPILVHLHDLESGWIISYSIFIVVMLVTPFGIRSMNSRMELERQLQEANEQIKELVKRDERMRIARDLHDTLGHTLSMITLKSQLVGKLINKDLEKARLEVKEIERTSRSALKQVRELVSDMRTTTVAEELIETETILDAANISMTFKGDSKLEDIPSLTQNILSMCLREAVTNVVKHADAQNCLIQLTKNDGEIRLVVSDDGKGIIQNNEQGNGLKGIHERLALLDGNVTIHSEKGTKLTITVPIIVKEKKAGVVS